MRLSRNAWEGGRPTGCHDHFEQRNSVKRSILGLPMGGRPLYWGSLLALLLLCILGVESLSSGAVTLPSAKTPAVSVPSVTVPAVKTPVLTTPQVSTPPVSAPSVSTPSAPVSHAVGGAVSTVKAAAPAVGGTVSHLTSAPASIAHTVTSAPRSATSAVTSTAGAATSAVSSTASSTGASASSASGSTSSTSSSSTATTSTSSAHAAQSHSRSTPLTRRELARRQANQDAALRHLVAQNAGCLSQLAPEQARTLALRSGLNGQNPDSAVHVARILGVSPAREQTIEQGAVNALRTDAKGGCGPAPSPMTVAAVEFIAAHNGTLAAPLAPAPASLVAGSNVAPAASSNASSSAANGRAGSSGGTGSNSAASDGSLPQGPAIRSASITSGSHGSVGWDVAVLGLIALVALAVPFVLNTARYRRTMALAGGAAAAGTGPVAARNVPSSAPAAAPADVMAPAAAAPAADAASLWIPATAARETAAPDAADASASSAASEAPAAPEATATPAVSATPGTSAAAPVRPAPTTEKRRPRQPTWLREHGSQAAMLAAGIGGAARLLLRGRRR